MNVMYRRLSVMTTVILMAPPQLASANPKAEAKQHVDRAAKLHEQGKFSEALDELKTAFSLHPKSELLYAMGQLHVLLGQCPQAITYYRRYLATKPAADTANAAHEAIEVCRTNPPPAPAPTGGNQPAGDAPPVIDRPPPAASSAPLSPEPEVASERAWYGDYIADALVVGGAAAGVVGIFQYRSAVQDRDRADTATNFQSYVDLVDRAHSQRTTGIVFGAAGAALVVAGGLHYMLTDRPARHAVSIGPSRGGGMVTFTGWLP
jgi:tetratricopeptide (TPR) repeat protein